MGEMGGLLPGFGGIRPNPAVSNGLDRFWATCDESLLRPGSSDIGRPPAWAPPSIDNSRATREGTPRGVRGEAPTLSESRSSAPLVRKGNFGIKPRPTCEVRLLILPGLPMLCLGVAPAPTKASLGGQMVLRSGL